MVERVVDPERREGEGDAGKHACDGHEPEARADVVDSRNSVNGRECTGERTQGCVFSRLAAPFAPERDVSGEAAVGGRRRHGNFRRTPPGRWRRRRSRGGRRRQRRGPGTRAGDAFRCARRGSRSRAPRGRRCRARRSSTAVDRRRRDGGRGRRGAARSAGRRERRAALPVAGHGSAVCRRSWRHPARRGRRPRAA